MIDEIVRIENSLLKVYELKISDLTEDHECEEYSGFNFQINNRRVKFRKAKITPKKTGLFVTLWKRNSEGDTIPFHVDDDFDFYIIAAEQDQNFGFFLFPKAVLSEKQILTNDSKEGKRGCRVYPNWCIPENKQAQKTKMWQTKYFIDFCKKEEDIFVDFERIFFSEQ